jgi:hypothetical protein
VRRGLAIFVVLACRDGALSDADAHWAVSPASVVLPTVKVGSTSTNTILLSNRGQAPVHLELHVDAPFGVSTRAELGGGATAALTVTFAPTQAGTFASPLQIGGDGASAEVAVSGQADPNCGRDGDPCTADCLENATCQGGVCVGDPRDCSDDDACTLDTCEEGSGCSHAPTECPAPDPCHAPTCDRLAGCGGAQLPDGTRCGESDCVTSLVCVDGACVTRATPEGASCGQPSPCQLAGVCHASVCVQPPPTVLMPEWTTSAPGTIEFSGVIDAQGNVYFLECGSSSCDLVSRTPAGAERFRVTTHLYASVAFFSDLILVGSHVVIADPSSDLVAAFDTGDGTSAWEAHLVPGCLDGTYYTGCTLNDDGGAAFGGELWPVLGDGAGHLLVGLNVGGTLGPAIGHDTVTLTTLDVATGSTISSAITLGGSLSSVVDERGNLFAAAQAWWEGPQTVMSFDAGCTRRWEEHYPSSASLTLQAAFDGILVMNDSGSRLRVLNASDGVELSSAAISSSTWGGLISAHPSRVMSFAQPAPSLPINLMVTDLPSGSSHTQPIRNGLGQYVTQATSPLLTSHQTLVTGVFAPGGGWRLDELALDGGVLVDCALPPAVNYQEASASPGHWVALWENPMNGKTQVMSFAYPGLDLADAGWVTARGQPTQEGRAR